MKIRNLSGAIRKIEGPAFITIVTDLGPLRLPLMKAGTLTAIRDAAGDDGQRETALSVTEAGDLVGWESWATGVGELADEETFDEDEVLTGDPGIFDYMADDQIDLEDAIAATPADNDDLADLLG